MTCFDFLEMEEFEIRTTRIYVNVVKFFVNLALKYLHDSEDVKNEDIPKV